MPQRSRSCGAAPMILGLRDITITENIIKMAKEEKVLDRIGTINANSVTDKEFEDVWGVTLDECVNQLMDYWDAKVSETRDAIGVTNK